MSEPATTRIPRRQFGIRALLVLTTIAACLLWWYVQIPVGTITMKQALQATKGMTQTEIKSLLGAPKSTNYWTRHETWYYEVKASDSFEESLLIGFDSDGRASWIDLSKGGWNSYPPQ